MLDIVLSAIENEEDRDFVAEIFQKYEKKLYIKAMSITKNKQDSEDCVLEVLIKIIDKLELFKSLDEKGQLLYLLRTCENISIDKYRENKYKIEHEHSTDEMFDAGMYEEENQLDIIISQENCRNIIKAIESMEPQHRDILYFRCVENMEYEDIAELLNIPLQQAYVRFYRAKNRLLKMQEGKTNEICRK